MIKRVDINSILECAKFETLGFLSYVIDKFKAHFNMKSVEIAFNKITKKDRQSVNKFKQKFIETKIQEKECIICL